MTHVPKRGIFVSVATGYLVRFNERRPNGRTRALHIQRIGPAPVAEVWRWVGAMLAGSTPDVLERIIEVKVAPEGVTAPEGAPHE